MESGRGPVAHVAHYCRSGHTVLGETADPKEVFPILDCENVPLVDVLRKIEVTYWSGELCNTSPPPPPTHFSDGYSS